MLCSLNGTLRILIRLVLFSSSSAVLGDSKQVEKVVDATAVTDREQPTGDDCVGSVDPVAQHDRAVYYVVLDHYHRGRSLGLFWTENVGHFCGKSPP